MADGNQRQVVDLSIDPGEKADLRRTDAEMFDAIRRQDLAWNAQMLPKP